MDTTSNQLLLFVARFYARFFRQRHIIPCTVVSFEETPCQNMAAKKSTCAREGFLKKVGILAGGSHFFICTCCSKTTLRLQTFKKGGMLRLAAMLCQGVLFTEWRRLRQGMRHIVGFPCNCNCEKCCVHQMSCFSAVIVKRLYVYQNDFRIQKKITVFNVNVLISLYA